MKGPRLLASARMVTKYWRTGEVKKIQDFDFVPLCDRF